MAVVLEIMQTDLGTFARLLPGTVDIGQALIPTLDNILDQNREHQRSNLEAGRRPLHELDGPLGLHDLDGGVDVLGHGVSSEQQDTRHVLPFTGQTNYGYFGLQIQNKFAAAIRKQNVMRKLV